MNFSRRETFGLGLGAVALTMLPVGASAATVDELIAEFTGGADMADTGVTLTAPEIAENGNTVPIEVDAPGAVAIAVFAAGNPTPGVGTFKFGPLAGAQMAATRIRLSGTQDVVAVAQMADGSFEHPTDDHFRCYEPGLAWLLLDAADKADGYDWLESIAAKQLRFMSADGGKLYYGLRANDFASGLALLSFATAGEILKRRDPEVWADAVQGVFDQGEEIW